MFPKLSEYTTAVILSSSYPEELITSQNRRGSSKPLRRSSPPRSPAVSLHSAGYFFLCSLSRIEVSGRRRHTLLGVPLSWKSLRLWKSKRFGPEWRDGGRPRTWMWDGCEMKWKRRISVVGWLKAPYELGLPLPSTHTGGMCRRRPHTHLSV